jgi:thiol:disulfide interchange protein DsbA
MYINTLSKMTKLLSVLAFSLLMLACSDGSQYQQDTHYKTFNNAIDDITAQHIELKEVHVIEFFTYGCSHCQAFAPDFKKWTKSNKLNVKYVPIVWSEFTDLHARAFFLIKSHKDFDQLHMGLFKLVAGFSRTDSIEDQKIELITWLQTQGIQPIDALNALNSTVFEQDLALSVLLAKRFQVTGTPTLVINNTYRINNKAMTHQSELLEVAEALLDK